MRANIGPSKDRRASIHALQLWTHNRKLYQMKDIEFF